MHQPRATRSDEHLGRRGVGVRRLGPLRRLVVLALLFVSVSSSIGCLVPIYSSSKDERARQLIFVSESLRHIPLIWERIWGLDMPDTATPYRVHGGVI